MTIEPELVSPAGSFEKMLFAFEYGADAVYLGAKSFSLREGAANLTIEELEKAVLKAHQSDKKVYLTANIFYHDRHFEAFKIFLEEIKHIPLDALIVSDIGAVSYIKEKYPDYSIHISTQANTTNSFSARFYEKLGVKRIILARELSFEEIKKIRDTVTVKLEAFVHGAMCISYSGRCLLSNYFTNQSIYRNGEKLGGMRRPKTRDANLGDCAQNCRWTYYLVESTRKNDFIPVEEEEYGTAVLSSKDLNLSGHMKELMDAGIDAFKIEGRMKSVYYTANVTRVYRYAVDAALRNEKTGPEILKELEKVSHREYTTGFYFGENMALNSTAGTGYIREYTFLGHVLNKAGEKKALVRAMNQIKHGAPVEIIRPDCKNLILKHFRLMKDDKAVDKVQPNDEFILEWDDGIELNKYDILRRKN